ncbi:MAG TPA: hypothetical protein VHD56_12140 [Tepidisphaeraceae bacterium]|nr:hypothetical protein [Tepidisphaeraceae bacterium]
MCIYSFWAARDYAVDGVLRSVSLVCAMIFVHERGYSAYQRQFHADNSLADSAKPRRMKITWELSANLIGTVVSVPAVLVTQIVVLLFASIILDGGQILNYCSAAFVCFWLSTGIIWLMRTNPPTKIDGAMFHLGFLLLIPVIILGAHIVWQLKGLPDW